tara:strand:+ start:477 stop:692 length:216 start_codon:yes stop_codon:yes gene_type:complete
MSGFNPFKFTIVQEEKQVCPKKSASAKKGWITRKSSKEYIEEREEREAQEDWDSEDWENLPKLFKGEKNNE